MASQTVVRAPQLPGYAQELTRTESDIAELESRRRSHPGDLEKRVRLAYRLFHRASLTGSIAHFEAVDAAIREALDEFGPKEDVCLLKANLDFRFHRLAEVRQDLHMCQQYATVPVNSKHNRRIAERSPRLDRGHAHLDLREGKDVFNNIAHLLRLMPNSLPLAG